MNLAEVLDRIERQKLLLRPAGFFNVEGGDAAAATDYFRWCDSCLDILGPVSKLCQDCGRKPGEFIRVPAGDGDGVYVVFELYAPTSPESGLGALVIFDNQYEIANSVRDQILEESMPVPPIDLFLKRGNVTLTSLGHMAASDKILISDGSAGKDSKSATVDVQLGRKESLLAFAFGEQVSSDIEDEATRLEVEVGMDRGSVLAMLEDLFESSQALTDTPKGYGSLPEISFRGLLILPDHLSESLGLEAVNTQLDWDALTGQFMGKICTSHAQTMDAAAVWFNVLLHREIQRAAGDVSIYERVRLLFNMLTWVYHGLHNLDNECRPLLNNAYLPTNDVVVDLLKRRGLFEAAEEFLRSGKIGHSVIPIAGSSGNSFADLPRSSETLLGVSTKSVAKFCGECGTKFETDSDKYCSECGTPR